MAWVGADKSGLLGILVCGWLSVQHKNPVCVDRGPMAYLPCLTQVLVSRTSEPCYGHMASQRTSGL